MRCPDQALLAAWVDGEADARVAGAGGNALSTHLDGCDRCLRVVLGHRQVKRRTASLTRLPGPVPGHDLLSSLLRVPAAEHARDREARCAAGAASPSRVTGVALGAVAVAGVVAVAWSAPMGASAASGAGPEQAQPTRAPATAPAPAPIATVSLGRWSGPDD